MKTPEEILSKFESENCWVLANNLTSEVIIPSMEEYGNQQYNQAIKDAAENAKAFFFYDDFDGSPEFGVNKDSILKLVKP